MPDEESKAGKAPEAENREAGAEEAAPEKPGKGAGRKSEPPEAGPEATPAKKARARKPRKTEKPEKKAARKPAKLGESRDGELTFDPSIITEIAIREAQQIDGIVQLTGSFMDDWVLRRGKGVHVAEVADNGEEVYSLDLKISVEYGVDCVKLATEVRERISKAIKTMTGRDTRKIDVHVTGIAHKEMEPPPDSGEDAPVEEGTGIDF